MSPKTLSIVVCCATVFAANAAKYELFDGTGKITCNKLEAGVVNVDDLGG